MMGSQISYTPRHFYSCRFGKGADDQCAKFGADPSCPPAGVDYVLVLQNRRQLTFRHLADRPRLCENSSLKRTIADRNSGEADEPIHRG